jgi:hypothetical protein
LVFRVCLGGHGPPAGDLDPPDGHAVEEREGARDQYAEYGRHIDSPDQLPVPVGPNSDAHVTNHLSVSCEHRCMGADPHSPCRGGGLLLYRQSMGLGDFSLPWGWLVHLHGR